MAVSSGPLGMNARNFLYIRKYNSSRLKNIADNKLLAKRLFISHEIPTTRLIKAFNSRNSVRDFDWDLPGEGFVLKPARGFGGEGILVFSNWKKGRGRTISGKRYTVEQLESHIFDIFEGSYSLQDLPDKAYIEEKVVSHKFFRKYLTLGLADIRIVVFNNIPVMAMLRLPTNSSHGTANLHLGAIGVGIDIRTGITQHAIFSGKPVSKIPGTSFKLSGIKIPFWDDILLMAAKTQEVSGLGFMGVDIVFDSKIGPLVLEINARPGLEIQKANLDSLRSRMERVENIKVADVKRGVELAKTLFASSVVQNVNISPITLSVYEQVTFYSGEKQKTYNAKIDSGAYRTAIDWSVAKDLDLNLLPKKIWIDSANGRQLREVAKVEIMIAGKKIRTLATVTHRSHLQYPVIIGRKDMKGFVIDPSLSEAEEDNFDIN